MTYITQLLRHIRVLIANQKSDTERFTFTLPLSEVPRTEKPHMQTLTESAPPANQPDTALQFEDMVAKAQESVVLILVN